MGDRTVFMAGSVRGAETRWQRIAPKRSVPVRAAYERYVERQCQAFLRMVPREGVRPLYAEARLWAASEGIHEGKDPMASLLAYCRVRLPLPPFGVWLEDLRANPAPHALAASEHAVSEEDRIPSQVSVRRLDHDGRVWKAVLSVFHEGGNWRGFISFEASAAGRSPISVRTSNLFCEPQLNTVTEVFEAFTPTTLTGFLRSVLP